MSLSLAIALGAVLVGANAVAVRGAEPAHDPFVLHGGLELADAALEFFFLGGGKVGVAPAVVDAIVASAG